MEACAKEKKRHWFRDCKEDPVEVAKMMEKMHLKPSDGTRSKSKIDQEKKDNPQRPTLSRITRAPSSMDVVIEDELASMQVCGQVDDGSDDSLASPSVVHKAVLEGIGRLSKIKPVTFNLALSKNSEPEAFTFSRAWLVSRTILHLSSGRLAATNISYLVADEELTATDLIIGRPILEHMRVDTKTLIEERREGLDNIDCSTVGNPTLPARGGRISAMMLARINRVQYGQMEAEDKRPRIDYFESRSERDPFPDPSLLDKVDEDQEQAVTDAIDGMLQQAAEHGLPTNDAARARELVGNYRNIFRVGLSGGAPAAISPLKIELTPDAKPARVKLRNYSREQREFLTEFVDSLEKKGLAYSNPTSRLLAASPARGRPREAVFHYA